MISMKLEGLASVKAQLAEVKAQVAERVLRRAARKAFAPVLADALARAPRDTGLLAEHIRLQVVRPEGPNTVVKVGLRIAPAPGARRHGRKTASPHWRWHFVELGTSKMAARPFLRPALDANAEQVVAILREELTAGLERAVRRQRKRAGG